MDAAKCTKARGNESDYGKKEAIGTITGSSPVGDVVKGAIDQALAYFSESRTLEAKPGFIYGFIVESESGKRIGVVLKQKGTSNFLKDIKDPRRTIEQNFGRC
jgi:hypothetical protein